MNNPSPPHLPALLLLQELDLLAEHLRPAAALSKHRLSLCVVAHGLFWEHLDVLNQGRHALIIFEGARMRGGGGGVARHLTHSSHNSTFVLIFFPPFYSKKSHTC